MNDQSPKSFALVLWIIWFALTASVFVYYVIAQGSGKSPDADSGNDMLVKILGGVAVVNILVSMAVRKRMTQPAAANGVTADNFQKILTGSIISWALAEAVAIYGLILALQGTPMSTCAAFMVASFATMVFLSPNFASLKG